MAKVVFVSTLCVLLIAFPVAPHLISELSAQSPPDRLEPTQALATVADVLEVELSQADTLQGISEAVSRIEAIVADTNEKVATQSDVADILARLSQARSNVAEVNCDTVATQVIQTHQATPQAVLGGSVLTSGGFVVNQGEVLMSVDGVPVSQSQPVAQSVPVSSITARRPFREVTVTGPNAGVQVSPGQIGVTTNGGQCYTDPQTGQTTCPSYQPNSLAPLNQNTGSSRRGLFSRLFRR